MSKIENIAIDIKQLRKKLGLDDEINYELTKHDNPLFSKTSKAVKYVKWDSHSRSAIYHEEPILGYSLYMSPFNSHFTWRTTKIVEIIRQEEGLLEFKTYNSHYLLKTI